MIRKLFPLLHSCKNFKFRVRNESIRIIRSDVQKESTRITKNFVIFLTKISTFSLIKKASFLRSETIKTKHHKRFTNTYRPDYSLLLYEQLQDLKQMLKEKHIQLMSNHISPQDLYRRNVSRWVSSEWWRDRSTE